MPMIIILFNGLVKTKTVQGSSFSFNAVSNTYKTHNGKTFILQEKLHFT